MSGYQLGNGFSKTKLPNILVPAEIFPLLTLMLFVATIPVPASPSGGQSGMPGTRCPSKSKIFAPSKVNFPASLPTSIIFGNKPSTFLLKPYCLNNSFTFFRYPL